MLAPFPFDVKGPPDGSLPITDQKTGSCSKGLNCRGNSNKAARVTPFLHGIPWGKGGIEKKESNKISS